MAVTEGDGRPKPKFDPKDWPIVGGAILGTAAGLTLILSLGHLTHDLTKETKIGNDTYTTINSLLGGVREVYLDRLNQGTGKEERIFDLVVSAESKSRRIYIIRTQDDSQLREAMDYINMKCGGATGQIENFVEVPTSECLG